MNDHADTVFHPGHNIAMKVLPHQFDATVAFYRDVLGFPHLGSDEGSESFAFGSFRLWIDRVPTLSQANIWLEVQCDDKKKAAHLLKAGGVTRCDDIEPLPGCVDGFWIVNPAGIVHLIDPLKRDFNSPGDTSP